MGFKKVGKGYPCGGAWNTGAARQQGDAKGDVSDCRQAGNPVYRGGSGSVGNRGHINHNKRKGIIEDHFDHAVELEQRLEASGKPQC